VGEALIQSQLEAGNPKMAGRSFLVHHPVYISLVLGLVVILSTSGAFGQERAEIGIVVGHVSLSDDIEDSARIQAVLMSGQWTSVWNSQVQQRIDNYFAVNSVAINQNPDLFSLISTRAQREAIQFVMSQMQQTLGAEFNDSVVDVSSVGSFEFPRVPFGTYRIIVVGQVGEEQRIWSGTVTVRSEIPEFVEIQDRIQ
jgi:hypothetical protein